MRHYQQNTTNTPQHNKLHAKFNTKGAMTPNTEAEPNDATDLIASSPLMKLPPELREIIYEYALRLDDGIIQISWTAGIPEPPLLLTCKTVRREAIAIFYTLNSIRLVVESLSPTVPLFAHKKQLAMLAQYQYSFSASQVMLLGLPRWPNLLAWLRLVHENSYSTVVFFRPSSPLDTNHQHSHGVTEQDQEMTVLAGLFRMVHLMPLEPWHEIERTLAMLRYGLVRYDSEWDVE